MKQSLVALLVAAAVVVPSSAEATGGKDGGAKQEAREQNRGGDFEDRGGQNKQRQEDHAPRFQQHAGHGQRGPAAFPERGNGEAKHAKRERQSPVEVFSVADRPQKRQSAKMARWKEERRLAPVERQRTYVLQEREVARPKLARRDDRDFKSERKAEKRGLKQQLASYRAEDKLDRRWVKQQRQALKQASTVEPVVVYDRSYADARRSVRYVEAPLYFTPEATPYRSYSSGYGYSPQYLTHEAYSYVGSYYPQSYSGLPPYSPYDASYDSGSGGLFGGGAGGLGDILVTLLPLLFGDALGFGGFATDQLGTGLLGSGYGTPNYAGDYDPYDQSELNYEAPGYHDPYQGAYVDEGILEDGQSLMGGDGLMSLLELALGSGLLGGNMGGLNGLGGLAGLGGVVGSNDGLGVSDPVYAYADPYADREGLLTGWGV